MRPDEVKLTYGLPPDDDTRGDGRFRDEDGTYLNRTSHPPGYYVRTVILSDGRHWHAILFPQPGTRQRACFAEFTNPKSAGHARAKEAIAAHATARGL